MKKLIITLLVICMIAALCIVSVSAAEMDSPQTQEPTTTAFGIVTVAVITALVYIIGLGVKATNLDNKWIPAICGLCGIILGIVALYVGVPNFPAADPLTAAAVGGASGLAATGIDQIAKQLTQ